MMYDDIDHKTIQTKQFVFVGHYSFKSYFSLMIFQIMI